MSGRVALRPGAIINFLQLLSVRLQGTFMRLKLIVFALVALTGCTSQQDYDHLLAATLLTVEHGGSIETIALSPSLTPEAREAAKNLRKVVEQSEVVPANGYELPSGYFVLKAITISGGTAHVIGTAGPIPSGATLACGATYDISFIRTGGRWEQGEMETRVC